MLLSVPERRDGEAPMRSIDLASWIRENGPLSLLLALYVGIVAMELARAAGL